MRSIWCAPVVAGLVLMNASAARADDQAELRALIDKSIKAMGGAEKITKYEAGTWKAKGKFYGLGDGIDYAGEWHGQGTDKARFTIDIEVMGIKVKSTQVLNKDKGWIKVIAGGNTVDMEMTKDMVDEGKEQAHAQHVASLVPFAKKDKTLQLAALGEMKIKGRDAIGIRVSSKGHRDVNLYFDKQTSLIVKQEWRARDFMPGADGKEVGQEFYLSDYKDVDGLMSAMKFEMHQDGKLFLDGEVTDLKALEKLDESLFEKP